MATSFLSFSRRVDKEIVLKIHLLSEIKASGHFNNAVELLKRALNDDRDSLSSPNASRTNAV